MGVDSSDVSGANKKQVEQLMMAGLHVQESSSSWHSWHSLAGCTSRCVDVMLKLEKFTDLFMTQLASSFGISGNE